jgi:hypothetical protein
MAESENKFNIATKKETEKESYNTLPFANRNVNVCRTDTPLEN